MFKNTIFRRMTALVLTLALAAAAALPGLAVYPMPIQTASETEAVYLFNADTGKTILNQNADQQQYVASLTKLMTALLLLESGKDLNGEVTVPTALTQEFRDIQNANGTTMGLRIGETVHRIDLLNAMLIVSANDAASVIAYDVGGSVLDFVKQMNARAQELGCTGTNFTCAHGLFDYGNVSTAQDLAKIAAACAANQTFAQVAGTASYVLPATNLRKAEHTISSSNSLMNSESANYREYVRWVKGGFTTLAGRCIVAFAEKDGHTYGLVILGCDTPDHLFAECDDLFDWAFASFADRPLVDTQTVLTTVDLTKCRTEPAVELYAAAPVSGTLMFKNTIFRRMTALVLTLALAAAAALPGLAVYPMPIQTASETEAVYLFNADTGKTILNQNADQQQYVASLTKLMTALLLLESGKDLNGEVTVPTALTQEFRDIQNANGTTMGLRIGETVHRIDLLNAMLIVSANDAASVIAYDVGGSVLDFVKQMNARAQELGCTGTNFTCAHGLFDYGNVSTAQDLAKIAAACAANQTFAQVAGTASYVLPATNLRKAEHTISSSNSLMNSESANYREYVRWVKGGFTTLAGRCIVAFAEKDGHTYGLVILGCDTPDHLFAECDDLFDWAFASFADRPLVDTQTVLTTVDLTKCRTEPAVELYAAAPVSGYGHADDIVTYSFDLPESIAATVKSGSVVGTATVYLDGDEVGTVDLVTHREYVSDFRTDTKATALLLCALLFILIALTAVTLAAGGGSLNLKRRKHRR